MVEVDIQFLAGVAVTVFLALIFFAVVVLWDISLALRSVGDKIDKLEDNLDDDLKDIGYGINTLSNAPGGGTQLHLNSGGTISSGPQPSAEEPRDESGPERPHSAQSAHGATRDPSESPRGEMDAQTRRSQTADEGVAATSDGPTDDSLGPEDGDSLEGSDESVDDSAEQVDDEEPETADETAAEDRGPSTAEESAESESASVAHPNATWNRGRFITSPDRTPWYRTALDREAIAEGNSTPIAGALESPAVFDTDEDDEQHESADGATDIDAPSPAGAGDDELDADADSEDKDGETGTSTVYAAPPANSSDQPEAISPEADAAVDDQDTEADDPSTETESALEDAVEDALEGIAANPGTTESSEDERDSVEEAAEPGVETPDSATKPEDETPDSATKPEDETPDSASRSASDEFRRITFDETELEAESGEETDPEPLEESSVSTDNTADDASSGMFDPADDGDETHAESAVDGDSGDTVESDESATDGSEDSTESDEDEPAVDSTEPAPIPLDEALEALTEGGPELTFSSHGFDVSSVEDDDGVVLTFEFDPETVEIQGSTKRLLTYQLQSFADQASTPEGDVTIGDQRIVIEIPNADGNAIEQWGDAAVTSIDRTLYLSDSE
ncbi:hypothetical protein OB919_17965 [Halobacteria archaeon AArc-curdl1]|uniref:Uncharacterized protein n=1 Tax=Natronosalvus hydrolyticus TaxID=2979988 RepID=A0AAP2ZDD3_9EURY|nr:hypothetical protein [Halobacteria archaeon AArc-curdl1]